MKQASFHLIANKLWMEVAGVPGSHQLMKLELELYKKLLTFFQAGDYYYYIFNFPAREFDVIGDGIEKVLGWRPEEVTVAGLMDSMHPEDRPYFINFEAEVFKFYNRLPIEKIFKYKVRADFRLRHKNGHYVRILHQVSVIEHDEHGGFIRTLAVHTDITHLKPNGTPTLSFIGMEGEPSFVNVACQQIFAPVKEILSRRERQVLELILAGKASKEISHILNISKNTVDNHRKNMLRKSGTTNAGELIGKAIREGWI